MATNIFLLHLCLIYGLSKLHENIHLFQFEKDFQLVVYIGTNLSYHLASNIENGVV